MVAGLLCEGVTAVLPIFPSSYLYPQYGTIFNPYFGGFGHLNLPTAGAGFTWPAYTWPLNLQSPALYTVQAGFVA